MLMRWELNLSLFTRNQYLRQPTCDTNLVIPSLAVISSGNLPQYVPKFAIDDNSGTKWWSTNTPNPFIQIDLGVSKSICKVSSPGQTEVHISIPLIYWSILKEQEQPGSLYTQEQL